MSNGEVCCILGVCCPPGSDEQHEALVHEIQKRHPHLDDIKAGKKADKILKHFNNFREIAVIVDEGIAQA